MSKLEKLRDELVLDVRITSKGFRACYQYGFDVCLKALQSQAGEFDEAWRRNIVEKAQLAFRRSQGGARGQMITEADSLDYWLITTVVSEMSAQVEALLESNERFKEYLREKDAEIAELKQKLSVAREALSEISEFHSNHEPTIAAEIATEALAKLKS